MEPHPNPVAWRSASLIASLFAGAARAGPVADIAPALESMCHGDPIAAMSLLRKAADAGHARGAAAPARAGQGLNASEEGHVVIAGTPGISISSRRTRTFPDLGIAALLLLSMLAAAPTHAADPTRGAPLYERYCASCHGTGGRSVWPGAPDFGRAGVLLKGDSQLLAVMRRGRGVMPSYLGLLKDRDLLDLIAYLRTLS